jgi:hypothetical protein
MDSQMDYRAYRSECGAGRGYSFLGARLAGCGLVGF